jgi:hypothetical protein
MKELNRLRDEWAIGRGNAEFGGDAGWVVCRDVGEDSVERIGWGKTVKAAIDAAEAYVARPRGVPTTNGAGPPAS